MIARLAASILALLFAFEISANEVTGTVHITDWAEGRTQFFYFSEDRLLRLSYKYDPAEEAFWNVSPTWSEQRLSAEDIDEINTMFETLGLGGWKGRYENVPAGEKVCRGVSWKVDIQASSGKYFSSGLCDAPDKLKALRAYLEGFETSK